MLHLHLPHVVAALVTLLSYPSVQLLPQWVAWENKPVEIAGSLALFVGLVSALLYAWRSGGNWRWLWLAAAPIWLLLLGRELSWGAVFFPPTAISEQGPFFSSSELWYKPVVYPIAVLFGVGTAFILFRHRLWLKLIKLIHGGAAPFAEVILAGICVVLATAAEGHGGPLTDWIGGQSLVLEEVLELASVLWLLAAQLRIRLFQFREEDERESGLAATTRL